VTVRRAAAADAARIAELSGVLGYPVAADNVRQRLERLLPRAEDVVFVATTSGGDVVGWIHAAEHELLETGRHAEILGLVVAADHRSQGAGRDLVEAAEQWASSRGVEQMAVRSNVVRTESHPFYERLGYARVKTQHAYGKRLSPAAT